MAIDIDTRRAAEKLMDRYGKDAITRAEERAAALQAKHDHEGAARWRRIAAAIRDLQAGLRSAKDRQT